VLSYFVALTALSIALIDIRKHLIPNELTILLGFLLLADPHSSSIVSTLPAIAVSIAVGLLGRFGAGDIKLFIVLLLTSSPMVLNLQYLHGMALASFGTVVLSLLARGRHAKMIAFAPAILLPFLNIYLAI
jgi:Flp pilus assembly protein protease CpaA